MTLSRDLHCIPCWRRLGFPKSLNMYTSFINVRRDA